MAPGKSISKQPHQKQTSFEQVKLLKEQMRQQEVKMEEV